MRIQLLCLLVLSTSVLGQTTNDRWEKFINQHIDNDMNVKKCDDVIRHRHITMTNSKSCKETNTFIRTTNKPVKAVCGREGKPYGNMTISIKRFPVIVCKLRKKVHYPRCQYRGRATTKYIIISCKDGYPVHFDRDIGLTDQKPTF